MSKTCKECNNRIWARGYCQHHDRINNPSKYQIKKTGITSKSSGDRVSKGLKRSPTGELELFKRLYEERNQTCQLTGKWIAFDVNCFAHILGKGSHGKFRLNPDNILMVDKRIHQLYDHEGRDKLLAEFPEAEVIYELKEKLRWKYYNEK